MRHLAASLVVLAGGLAFLAFLGPGADAGDKKAAHLDYKRTYLEALTESRLRNVPLIVSRHKDD